MSRTQLSRPGAGTAAAPLGDVSRNAPAARGRFSRSLTLLGTLLGLAALVAVFVVASRSAYGGNSDDATLVLQGRSMAGGNLTLSGWDLSYDAFWTSEVPFYALAAALFGVREEIMYLVPAVVGALLVLAAAWLALPAGGLRRAAKSRCPALVALGTVLVLLAVPSPVLAYFVLQGGWHAVTALLSLIVFAGVARSSTRLGLGVAIVALSAVLLGDLLSAVITAMPLVIAGAIALRRTSSWRAASRHLTVVAGGILLAVAARLVALTVGTYAIGSRSILATPSQVLWNVGSLPSRVGGMFGVTDIVGGVSASPWPLRLAHFVLLCAVLAALGRALAGLVIAVVREPSQTIGQSTPSPDWRLDDILVFAVLADLGTYVAFATDSATALARYLVPGVVFGVVLTARWLSRLTAGLSAPSRRHLAVAGLALGLCCAVDFGLDTIGPAAPQEARPLAAFLAAHHLDLGVGDYWSSSIVTVDSSGVVQVRPVQLGAHDTLVRYDKQSDAAWYRSARFEFFVSDSASPWHGVTSAAAVQAFGPPRHSYIVGTYHVLVWSHPLTLGS